MLICFAVTTNGRSFVSKPLPTEVKLAVHADTDGSIHASNRDGAALFPVTTNGRSFVSTPLPTEVKLTVHANTHGSIHASNMDRAEPFPVPPSPESNQHRGQGD
ncbi:hypothetical protein Syun_029956 [Stephania yunnanensis]|uniref:Uncharacterized protein n=1 Tax=Stephania yunnanensis TaxID=152371 RepID=A0AAP0E9W8_9MAGN